MASKQRILVIAGSDSSGGAGLEADQKVIAAHGCYAMTATTALTAQNTLGVTGIHITPSDFVQKQIEANISDIGVDVVKIGMLASKETVKMVSDMLFKYNLKQNVAVILDPVMVSTSGAQLLPQDAVDILRDELLEEVSIVTPNIPEAKLLLTSLGHEVSDPQTVDDLVDMARAMNSFGPDVLLKGGHLPLSKDRIVPREDADRHLVVDILYKGQTSEREASHEILESPYIQSKDTHGTGCSLASAIASRIALGDSISDAVKAAKRYVEAGIRLSRGYGGGSGPINHFHSTHILPFAPGRFVDYVLSRSDVAPVWKNHTHHPFVQQLAAGTLPLPSFKHFLIQDYIYLVHFARANALAAYKASAIDDTAASARIVQHIHTEMDLHVSYCAGFGISRADIEATPEAMACTAYTRYVLDVGASQDWLALQVAFAPCLLGYGIIAERLARADDTVKGDGNIYWKWICNYVADDYVEAVRVGQELLEKHAALQSPSRIEELVKIFIHATKMEIGFWEMGSGGVSDEL